MERLGPRWEILWDWDDGNGGAGDDNGDGHDMVITMITVQVIHTVGTVGRVEWRDLGGHNYSGIFKGAQHGLVR